MPVREPLPLVRKTDSDHSRAYLSPPEFVTPCGKPTGHARPQASDQVTDAHFWPPTHVRGCLRRIPSPAIVAVGEAGRVGPDAVRLLQRA
jgi:hypothetical protein